MDERKPVDSSVPCSLGMQQFGELHSGGGGDDRQSVVVEVRRE